MDKDKPARADGVVRHNCLTCAHDGKGSDGCGAMGRSGLLTRDPAKREHREAINEWIYRCACRTGPDGEHGWAMPDGEGGGCPGWVQR